MGHNSYEDWEVELEEHYSPLVNGSRAPSRVPYRRKIPNSSLRRVSTLN